MKYAKNPIVCMIGLGYVGLPLAILFAKKFKTYGYDIKEKRIEELKKGIDVTGELSKQQLSAVKIVFSNKPEVISESNFIVVAVPTPVDEAKCPDFTPLVQSSKTVGDFLKKNSVVVFESTVYPGATEEVCAPIIEKHSDLKCGRDWVVGYSPERINPGDKEHTPEKIIKLTSGMDNQSANYVDKIYRQIIKAGTFKTKSIAVAEASKVIENIQRDINIAIVNEFALVFSKLGINIFDVLAAAGTKWAFHPYRPGLVGGHCIGVDPYYLIHRSQTYGYFPQLMVSARNINENMVNFCVERIVGLLVKAKKVIDSSKILVMGATFKENVRDIRNSKVFDLLNKLREYNIEVFLFDPVLDFEDLKGELELDEKHFLKNLDSLKNIDGICYAVNHEIFKTYDLKNLKTICKKTAVFFDIRGRFLNSPDRHLFVYKTI